MVFAAALITLAAVPLAFYFSPTPVRLGSLLLLPPHSYRRLDFIYRCGSRPDPNPAHSHYLKLVHRGRKSQRFWAREFHVWARIIALLDVEDTT